MVYVFTRLKWVIIFNAWNEGYIGELVNSKGTRRWD